MTKNEFLSKLERLLQSVKDREKTLSYYGELIDDFIEDGFTEEEAIQKVGKPGDIAEQLLTEELGKEDKQVKKGTKFVVGLLLVLGCPLWASLVLAFFCLLFAALLLVFSGYILIWCIPIITGSLALASVILSSVSTCGSFVIFSQNLALGLVQLGVGIIAAGIFILMGYLTFYLSRYFAKVTKQFSIWLYEICTKRVKEVKAWKK